MRSTSLRSALSAPLSLLLTLGAGCEISDFGHSRNKDGYDSDSKSLEAILSGENEVPPADSNASGSARLALDFDEDTLCFDLAIENVEPVTAAHVHQAPTGVNGPVVVDLNVATPPESCPTTGAAQALRAADGSPGDAFGRALAFEGDTAIVGANGAAYVLVRKDGVWSEQQKLTAPDADFGASVALSGDTAAVAADEVVHVFVRSYGVWSKQQTVTSPSQVVNEGFGAAVALSGDTLLAGAPFFFVDRDTDVGAAYVFERSGSSWFEQARLPSGLRFFQPSQFGRAVAVSGDFAFVGAPLGNAVRNVGFASLFERTGTVWTKVELDTTSSLGGQLGAAVALSGTTAIVGAPGHLVFEDELQHGDAVASGAAQVFERSGYAWVKQPMAPVPGQAPRFPLGLLTPNELEAGAGVGASVAVSGDRIVVGAPGSMSAGRPPPPNAAYVFSREANLWSEDEKLSPPEGEPAVGFGTTVGISHDTVLVGAPGDVSMPGTVFVHDLEGAPSCELPSQKFASCVDAESELLEAIHKHPEHYYVNVHTRDFPEGALRGQLERETAP